MIWKATTFLLCQQCGGQRKTQKKHLRYVLIQFASIHKHKHHMTDQWYLLQFYLQLIGKFKSSFHGQMYRDNNVFWMTIQNKDKKKNKGCFFFHQQHNLAVNCQFSVPKWIQVLLLCCLFIKVGKHFRAWNKTHTHTHAHFIQVPWDKHKISLWLKYLKSLYCT